MPVRPRHTRPEFHQVEAAIAAPLAQLGSNTGLSTCDCLQPRWAGWILRHEKCRPECACVLPWIAHFEAGVAALRSACSAVRYQPRASHEQKEGGAVDLRAIGLERLRVR